MPEYLAPGVYVEEVDTGSKPIEGVSTSTAGMVGVTERGPVNMPMLVTSYGEFTRLFGERLNALDYPNGHHFLPHAVEGFFTNGGKRVFVTRITAEGATPAAMPLFNRGGNNAANTVLLRTAPEQRGTNAAPPLPYLLSTDNIANGTWIRIGDGSNAEYRQADVVTANTANTHVPLDFPLSRSHDAASPAQQFVPAADTGAGNTYTADFVVAMPAPATTTQVGDQSVTIQVAAAADATALLTAQTAGTLPLLELRSAANADHREYRFARRVIQTAPLVFTVELDGPLFLTYANADPVTPLQETWPDALAARSNTLDTAANAGDSMIFVQARGGEFDTRNHLVVIEPANVPRREVRRIGALTQLEIANGPFAEYPTGSLVERVNVADDARAITVAIAAATTDTATVGSVAGLAVGQRVLLTRNGPPLNPPDAMTIRAINAGANQVTFTVQIANAHGVNDFVIPAPKRLTAEVRTAGTVLALDDRMGLNVGDVLRVGAGNDAEHVTIRVLPNRSDTAPDDGNVVLAHPLVLAHGTGTEVSRAIVSAPTAGVRQPTVTALEAGPGDINPLLATDGTGYTAPGFLRVRSGDRVYLHRVTAITGTGNASLVSVQTRPLTRGHRPGEAVVGRDPLLLAQALDTGIWGNRLRISVEDEAVGLVSRTTLQTRIDDRNIRLASAAGVEAGTILEFRDPATDEVIGPLQKVVFLDRTNNNTIRLAGTGLTPPQRVIGLRVVSREFRLTVYLLRQPDPALPSRNDMVIDSEVFRYLSMDPRHSYYIEKIIGAVDGPLRLSDNRPEGESSYIRVYDLARDIADPGDRQDALDSIRLGPETLVDVLPSGRTRPARHALTDGADLIETMTDDRYVGVDADDPIDRTGLFTLASVDEISIVACPGRTGPLVQGALITHCENLRYRFAVLDGPPPPNDALADVQTQRQQFDTKYAALYYPWLLIPDPFPVNLANIANYSIPPSGHVIGVYARTDIERGVHKAPANEVVRGILGLQRTLNKAQQDILNPYPTNINVIRDFRPDNRGIRIYGGRVITSDSDYKYVNVRRLMIYIEASLDRGLQWVVFEPNAEPLWARVTRAISSFLTGVWRDGALEGTKPEEAYFVKCDRTTMTQQDIDTGRLIALIGVAPVKPAEFVIIRIGLWTAHADT